MERRTINFKINIFLFTATTDAVWQAAGVYILICPSLKWSYWDLLWTYQKQLESHCKYLQPTRAAPHLPEFGCSVLGMDLLLGWIFASSCAVLGVLCRIQELLTCCWSEPCYQYQFQMLTAVSPLQMHGGLVNNNSPKNPMLSSIWKALGLWHGQDIKGWILNLLPGNSGEDLPWAQLGVVLFDLFCARTPGAEMISGELIPSCWCGTVSQRPECHTEDLPVSHIAFYSLNYSLN